MMNSSLKIAFIVRSTINSIVGGDSQQVINTARELEKLGLKVDIIRADQKVVYSKYDLLHFFNVIRPADHLYHIEKSKKPTVLSTIYLDYTEFDRNERNGIQKLLFRVVGRNGAEYLKNNFRFISGQDKLASLDYLLGHQRAIKKIISSTRLLLPNSISEYTRLQNDYGISKPYHVVPNGINEDVFGKIPQTNRENNRIICVGQIYALKNQYRLIKAVSGLDVELDIIGKSPPNHIRYLGLCKSIAGDNVNFHSFMDQDKLLEYYARAWVHALPSWFETTGLSSLEAGAMGCNLVVGSGGDTREYFEDKASFCNAHSVEDIRDAITVELNKPCDNNFKDIIFEKYTWRAAARETLKAYLKALEFEK